MLLQQFVQYKGLEKYYYNFSRAFQMSIIFIIFEYGYADWHLNHNEEK